MWTVVNTVGFLTLDLGSCRIEVKTGEGTRLGRAGSTSLYNLVVLPVKVVLPVVLPCSTTLGTTL